MRNRINKWNRKKVIYIWITLYSKSVLYKRFDWVIVNKPMTFFILGIYLFINLCYLWHFEIWDLLNGVKRIPNIITHLATTIMNSVIFSGSSSRTLVKNQQLSYPDKARLWIWPTVYAPISSNIVNSFTHIIQVLFPTLGDGGSGTEIPGRVSLRLKI